MQEAKEAAAAAAKAREDEEKQKAEEAAQKEEELAASRREMDEQKAKDRAVLEVTKPMMQSPIMHASTNGLQQHS